MTERTRRSFLRKTASMGLAASGGLLVLAAEARPTPPCADGEDPEEVLKKLGEPTSTALGDRRPTLPRGEGPFYRAGSPFRAKVSPPLEPGTVLVVSGRVWSFDTKKPLGGAQIDIWQADAGGNYSTAEGDYRNRVRLVAAEDGAFEFETIHPAGYQANPEIWRSPHIHFIASAAGHKRLVSEMFFQGDPKQDIDPFFHAALAVPVARHERGGVAYESAVFDVILERA